MRVFISYTHEFAELDDQVWNLCEALRSDGIDCHIDEHEKDSPAKGWPRWCAAQVQYSDFVLVVCTEVYRRRFEGREKAKKGLGAVWESAIITQELYDSGTATGKFIPVLFSPEDVGHIPVALRGQTYYDLSTPRAYDKLFRRLTRQPARVESPVASHIRCAPPEEHLNVQAMPVRARQLQFRDADSRARSNSGRLMLNVFDGTLIFRTA